MPTENFLIKNLDLTNMMPHKKSKNLNKLKNINKILLNSRVNKDHKDLVYFRKSKNFAVAKKEINKKSFDFKMNYCFRQKISRHFFF